MPFALITVTRELVVYYNAAKPTTGHYHCVQPFDQGFRYMSTGVSASKQRG